MLVAMVTSTATGVFRLRRTRVLVVGVLVAGALGLTLHPYLAHGDHGPEQTCEVCLHLSANPAAPTAAPPLPVPRAIAFILPAPTVSVPTAATPVVRSRAPPVPLV